MPARDAVWWGARKGGRVNVGEPAGKPPDREWIAVSSSDSSTLRSGRIVGSLSARVVFPTPFGPVSSM
jgi:hypothetical protein